MGTGGAWIEANKAFHASERDTERVKPTWADYQVKALEMVSALSVYGSGESTLSMAAAGLNYKHLSLSCEGRRPLIQVHGRS